MYQGFQLNLVWACQVIFCLKRLIFFSKFDMIKAKITFEVNMFDIISLLSKLEHSEQKQIMFMLVYIKSTTFLHGRKMYIHKLSSSYA